MPLKHGEMVDGAQSLIWLQMTLPIQNGSAHTWDILATFFGQ